MRAWSPEVRTLVRCAIAVGICAPFVGMVLLGWRELSRRAYEARIATELKEACVHVWAVKQERGSFPSAVYWRNDLLQSGTARQNLFSPLVLSVASARDEWLLDAHDYNDWPDCPMFVALPWDNSDVAASIRNRVVHVTDDGSTHVFDERGRELTFDWTSGYACDRYGTLSDWRDGLHPFVHRKLQ